MLIIVLKADAYGAKATLRINVKDDAHAHRVIANMANIEYWTM